MAKLTESKSQEDLVAFYILQQYSLCVVIPKRVKKGYYKSVFGYHSSNKKCWLFDEIKPDWFCSDTCDIDGYLQITLRLNTWDKRFDEGLELTLKCLKEVFPFVSEFKEDDNTFWNIVLNKK